MVNNPQFAPTIYDGWQAYQEFVIQALRPLHEAQLAQRARLTLRSVDEITRHISGANFPTGRAEPGLAGEGDNPFFMTPQADIASVATLRITTAHHLFDYILHLSPFVSWYLLLTIIPPEFPSG